MEQAIFAAHTTKDHSTDQHDHQHDIQPRDRRHRRSSHAAVHWSYILVLVGNWAGPRFYDFCCKASGSPIHRVSFAAVLREANGLEVPRVLGRKETNSLPGTSTMAVNSMKGTSSTNAPAAAMPTRLEAQA